MIRSLKASAVVLILALTSSYSFAADKVVVIPLGGDVSAKEFNSQHVWSGAVINNAKIGTGLYTVSHTAIGKYLITLNIDGFDFYDSYAQPIVSGWFSGAGSTILVQTVRTTLSDGKVVNSSFIVHTYDATNAFADKSFLFHAKFSEPNAPAPSSANVESAADNGATCTTVGELVTCVIGEE